MKDKAVIDKIREAILEGDEDLVITLADEVIADPTMLEEALDVAIKTIKHVGDQFGLGELYLPELISSADTMLKFMDIIEPHLEKTVRMARQSGKVVIGTVKGDIHTIGKDIVATMLGASGFEVIDMGVDVSPMEMIKNAQQANAQIIGLSALMTTSMPYQKEVIDVMKELGIRDSFRIAVGGGPVTAEYAKEIGANGWAADAAAAVKMCEQLISSKESPSTAPLIRGEV